MGAAVLVAIQTFFRYGRDAAQHHKTAVEYRSLFAAVREFGEGEFAGVSPNIERYRELRATRERIAKEAPVPPSQTSLFYSRWKAWRKGMKQEAASQYSVGSAGDDDLTAYDASTGMYVGVRRDGDRRELATAAVDGPERTPGEFDVTYREAYRPPSGLPV